jgi:hypothetical protein
VKNVWFLKTQEVGRRGVPDIIVCAAGRFLAFELKKEGGVTDSLQSYTLRKIIGAQGVGMVLKPSMWPKVFQAVKQIADGDDIRFIRSKLLC